VTGTLISSLIIDPRFNGPNSSGNGGWVSGRLARLLGDEPASVTLRAPTPLGVALSVRSQENGGIALESGDRLIAEAQVASLDVDVPSPPDWQEAEAAGALARRANAQGVEGPYARCFGCGLARSDGLSIVPGPVGNTGVVATTWTAPTVGSGGEFSVEATWAALDCSAGFAWMRQLPPETPIITARMTATIDQALVVGERYVVIGWPIAREGRKLHAGTAIFDVDGRIRARSKQLWLILRS
jgi:hypothetical protein